MGTASLKVLGLLAALVLESTPAHAPVTLPPLGPIAADGYAFEVKDHKHTKLIITMVLHKDYKTLAEAFHSYDDVPMKDGPGSGKYPVGAFTIWNQMKNANSCEIHVIDPAINYRPQDLGHEVTHCIYGSFHPTQPR